MWKCFLIFTIFSNFQINNLWLVCFWVDAEFRKTPTNRKLSINVLTFFVKSNNSQWCLSSSGHRYLPEHLKAQERIEPIRVCGKILEKYIWFFQTLWLHFLIFGKRHLTLHYVERKKTRKEMRTMHDLKKHHLQLLVSAFHFTVSCSANQGNSSCKAGRNGLLNQATTKSFSNMTANLSNSTSHFTNKLLWVVMCGQG